MRAVLDVRAVPPGLTHPWDHAQVTVQTFENRVRPGRGGAGLGGVVGRFTVGVGGKGLEGVSGCSQKG